MVNWIDRKGELSIIADIGAPNNGAISDRAGNLYIASSGFGAILKIDRNGVVSTVTAVSDGDSLLGPNDMAWDKSGRLYFTDPRGSSGERLIGGVHYIGRDGKTRRFAGGLAYPNGIAFNLDHTALYVTETSVDRLLRFDIRPDGTSGERRVLAEFPKGSVPDGMKVDSEGNLWIAVHTFGEIWRFSPDGKKLGTVKLPTKYVTNLVFGGPNRDVIYVTAFDDITAPTGSVYMIPAGVHRAPVLPPE